MNLAGVSGVAGSRSVVQSRDGWYQSSGRAGAVPATNQSVIVWPAQLGVASSPLALQTVTFFRPSGSAKSRTGLPASYALKMSRKIRPAPWTPQTTLRLEFTFV